jgi:hypothetical protein
MEGVMGFQIFSRKHQIGRMPVYGIVMNGVDVAKARLLKTTQGEICLGRSPSPIGTSQMWSIPVVKC